MNNFLTLLIICAVIITVMGFVDPTSTYTAGLLGAIGSDNPANFATSTYALLLIGGAGTLFIIASLVQKLLNFGTLNAQTLVMQAFVSTVVALVIADLSSIYSYTSTIMVGDFAFFGFVLKIIWIVLALSIIYFGYKMLVGQD